MKKLINCLVVNSDFMTVNMKKKILHKYEKFFLAAGLTIVDNYTNHCQFYFLLGGGTENQVYNRYKNAAKNTKIYIVAHDENNSLPAALELLAALKNKGIEGRIIFLNKNNDKYNMQVLQEQVEFVNVQQKMKDARIGLIGDSSDWLVASKPSAETVKKIWGPNLINVPIKRLLELDEMNIDMDDQIDTIKNSCERIIEPDEGDMIGSIKVYNRLKEIIKSQNLNAITVNCFKLLEETGITGCFALSQLNDRRLLAGCEGDVVSILAMLWSYYLTDSLPWMGNPSAIDVSRNSLILAHCTVPQTMVINHDIRSHFESGKGVAIAGELVSGNVTLLRIGGKDLRKIWCAEGRITDALSNPNLCRTQANIVLSNDYNIKDLLENPLGNHLVMIYGNHRKRLMDWWKMYVD